MQSPVTIDERADIQRRSLGRDVSKDCARPSEAVASFVFIGPGGKDPDQRNYIVSNAKIEATGFKPAYSLDCGIQELIKGYTMIKNSRYGNV